MFLDVRYVPSGSRTPPGSRRRRFLRFLREVSQDDGEPLVAGEPDMVDHREIVITDPELGVVGRYPPFSSFGSLPPAGSASAFARHPLSLHEHEIALYLVWSVNMPAPAGSRGIADEIVEIDGALERFSRLFQHTISFGSLPAPPCSAGPQFVPLRPAGFDGIR